MRGEGAGRRPAPCALLMACPAAQPVSVRVSLHCCSSHAQDLRGKLDSSQQEVERLEALLDKVGAQHSRALQDLKKKVGDVQGLLLCMYAAMASALSVSHDRSSRHQQAVLHGPTTTLVVQQSEQTTRLQWDYVSSLREHLAMLACATHCAAPRSAGSSRSS